MTSFTLPTPLVSTDWLAEHLGAVKLLDASWYLPTANRDPRAEYAAGHIPGAVYADIDRLSDERSPLPHTLLDDATFGARIAELGVSNDDAVVVYDGSGQNLSAPRLWWMLRSFGHERVAVLDGGFRKWSAEGRPIEQGVVTPPSGRFAATLDRARVRDVDAMLANVTSASEQVVDARSAGRFTAAEPEPRAGMRGGHIPGSRSLHYASLVRPDGTLRGADELRDMVRDAGLDLDRPIVASCGSGVSACAVVLALETLGARRTAVYDGSWSEWGGRPDTPIETGPPPDAPHPVRRMP